MTETRQITNIFGGITTATPPYILVNQQLTKA